MIFWNCLKIFQAVFLQFVNFLYANLSYINANDKKIELQNRNSSKTSISFEYGRLLNLQDERR